MPACNESWKKCDGFWDCTGAAFKTAAKCTANLAEDVATGWAHDENTKFRKVCFAYTECLWWKYTHGKIQKQDLLGDIHGKLAAQFTPAPFAFQEPVSGFQLLAKQGRLKGAKKMSAADKLLVDWLGAEAAIDVTGWQPTAQDLENALHEVGQSFGEAWVASFGKKATETAALFIGGPPLKGIVKAGNVQTEVLANLGECKQADWKKFAEAAIDVAVTSATGTDSGTIKAGVAGAKIGYAAATGSNIQMNDIYTLLEQAGIELPQPVKDFLNCAYAAMGDYLYKVLQTALGGDPDKAAKMAAPYLVNCTIQTLGDQISQDSSFKKWVKAAGTAVSAAIKANNATPPPLPPAPKSVPVTGAGSAGGVNAGCPAGYYKSLTGECKPQPAANAPLNQTLRPDVPGTTVRAADGQCKGPYEKNPALRCPEYNTPFWDKQRAIPDLPGATGPDATGADQLVRDKALATYQQQQQTQTLVLVAAAAAGLYLLSK